MSGSPPISLGAVILAAGYSRRMGRPKLLLPWGTTTVLGQLLRQWRDLPAAQMAVVCQEDDQPLNDELNRLKFPSAARIVNPDPSRGMFSSIQCAACWDGWATGLTHWAVVLGDQPHLAPRTLRGLIGFACRHPLNICQPALAGRARHPVLLPASAWAALGKTTAPTLKEFLSARAADVRLLELDDEGLGLDLDRPEDYEEAKRLFLRTR